MAMTPPTQNRPLAARRPAWLVTLLCWLIVVFDGYDLIVYGTTLPSLLKEKGWDLTPTSAGFIGSLAFAGMLVGALAAGLLSDRLGRQRADRGVRLAQAPLGHLDDDDVRRADRRLDRRPAGPVAAAHLRLAVDVCRRLRRRARPPAAVLPPAPRVPDLAAGPRPGGRGQGRRGAVRTRPRPERPRHRGARPRLPHHPAGPVPPPDGPVRGGHRRHALRVVRPRHVAAQADGLRP